jgi:predicted nucleic acid-binding Zn ribbon protein
VTDWLTQAACAPGGRYCDLPWLAEIAPQSDIALMAAVCGMCPVRQQCAAELEQYGDKVGFRAGVNWTIRKGQRTDRSRVPLRSCNWCLVRFVGSTKFCSEQCQSKFQVWDARRRACTVCGVAWQGHYRPDRRFCSRVCRDRAQESWANVDTQDSVWGDDARGRAAGEFT